MYSHDETVAAVRAFYEQVIKHPYLDDTALIIPPQDGWDNLDLVALRSKGKNETVINILRHLPYLRASDFYQRLLVQAETVPICYAHANQSHWSNPIMDEVYPLPGHCVYLTEGVDREGYSLILDTIRGKSKISWS